MPKFARFYAVRQLVRVISCELMLLIDRYPKTRRPAALVVIVQFAELFALLRNASANSQEDTAALVSSGDRANWTDSSQYKMGSFDGFAVQLAIYFNNRNEWIKQMVGKNADQLSRFSRKSWKKGCTRWWNMPRKVDRCEDVTA